MGAFDNMYNHFEKNMGNIGATRGIFREGSAARSIEAEDGDIRYMSKDDREEALKTIEDHEENELERTLDGIRRNREDEKGQPEEKSLEKATASTREARRTGNPVGRPRNPNAKYKTGANYEARSGQKWQNRAARLAGKLAGIQGDTRRRHGSDWRPGMGDAAKGTPKDRRKDKLYQSYTAGGEEAFVKREDAIANKIAGKQATQKAMLIEKRISPALSNLLAAAAGWALSADTASKEVPPEMAAEWERAHSREDKRRLQEEMIRRMKGLKKSDDGTFLDDLEMLYKEGNPFDWQGEDDDYDLDSESDPQWDAHAQDIGAHDVATQYGWGGKEPDVDDFHPESGERLNNHGQGAHDVQNWAKGIQAQTGVSLVNDLGEPHDAIYAHHGLGDDASVTAQHISDYVQNTTGQSVDLPGAGGNTIQNMLKYLFMKDHAPVPPRMGLMWDAVKHRWTRPEKVGRTVWEVQGKKRLRGTGTGAHERTRSTKGSGGKGAGSMEAGRRFRSVGDTGRARPHEAKRVGQVTHPKPKKQGGK